MNIILHPFVNESPFSPPLNKNYNINCNDNRTCMFYNHHWIVNEITPLIKYLFFTKQYPEMHIKIENILKNDPKSVNVQMSNGMTALMYAVRFYKIYTTKKIIKMLLDYGADISLKTYDIITGSLNEQWDVFDIISKFNINGKNNCILDLLNIKKNTLEQIKQSKTTFEKKDIFELLKSLPNIGVFEKLLQENKYNLDQLIENKTCFRYIIDEYYWNVKICHIGSYDIIYKSFELLIKYGANVDNRDGDMRSGPPEKAKAHATALEYIIDCTNCYDNGSDKDLVTVLLDNNFKYKDMTKLLSWLYYCSKTKLRVQSILEYLKKINDTDYAYIDDNGNTTLHHFVTWFSNRYIDDLIFFTNYRSLVEYLINRIDPLIKNKEGINMFHLYLMHYNTTGNELLKIEDLITPQLAVDPNNYGETPLYLAIKFNKLNAFKVIYNYDKNINHKKDGKTAIMHQFNFTNFKFFVDSCKNIDLNSKDNDGKSYSDLYLEHVKKHEYHSDNVLFIEYLLENKLVERNNPNLIELCNKITASCIFKDINGVKILCRYGLLANKIKFKQNYFDEKYEHILTAVLSINGSNYKLIKLIIDQGHILNEEKEIDILLSQYISRYIEETIKPDKYHQYTKDNPNENMILEDRLNILSLLIESHKKYYTLNYQDSNGWTILMKILGCIEKYHYDIIAFINDQLDKYWIDVNKQTHDKETLLTLLLRLRTDCNTLPLIEKIINRTCNIDHQTDTGMTPCMIAINHVEDKNMLLKIIKLFVKHNVKLDTVNTIGYTVLMIAYLNNQLEIIDYLESINTAVNVNNIEKIMKKSAYKERFKVKCMLDKN